MYCKQCYGEMNDTGSISYGMGVPIWRCVDCGYTSVCPLAGLPDGKLDEVNS